VAKTRDHPLLLSCPLRAASRKVFAGLADERPLNLSSFSESGSSKSSSSRCRGFSPRVEGVKGGDGGVGDGRRGRHVGDQRRGKAVGVQLPGNHAQETTDVGHVSCLRVRHWRASGAADVVFFFSLFSLSHTRTTPHPLWALNLASNVLSVEGLGILASPALVTAIIRLSGVGTMCGSCNGVVTGLATNGHPAARGTCVSMRCTSRNPTRTSWHKSIRGKHREPAPNEHGGPFARIASVLPPSRRRACCHQEQGRRVRESRRSTRPLPARARGRPCTRTQAVRKREVAICDSSCRCGPLLFLPDLRKPHLACCCYDTRLLFPCI